MPLDRNLVAQQKSLKNKTMNKKLIKLLREIIIFWISTIIYMIVAYGVPEGHPDAPFTSFPYNLILAPAVALSWIYSLIFEISERAIWNSVILFLIYIFIRGLYFLKQKIGI